MEKKYSIGVALSGGGIRGLCHAGALQAMEELNIRPNLISGVSAGAIVGALYADGHSPQDILKAFKSVSFLKMTKILVPEGGFFHMNSFERYLGKLLNAKNFEDLNIPLRIVATNFDEGHSQVFGEGNLLKPVIASSSIPVLFVPKKIKNQHFVDGGLMKNFPVSTIRDECETVIGINASPLTAPEYKMKIMDVALRTYHFMFRSNVLADKALCDIIIEPDHIYDYNLFETDKADEIYELGYQAALKVLKEQGFS
ncbi:MAG: phospholipase [Paludibacter sp. 47-17]|nr:MAG: phospholipase [Paludibacter sp. 47-17]